MTTLPSLSREYSLSEICDDDASGPPPSCWVCPIAAISAKGLRADVALYRPGKDIAQMFRAAAFVYKDGELVVRDGTVTALSLWPRIARDARGRSPQCSGE